MFEDITKSIKAYLYDRVSSPFLVTFVVAWFIWNYEVVLVYFSEMAALDKIKIINDSIFPDEKFVLLKGILYPFASAFFYVVIGSYIENLFYWFWLRRNSMLKKLKQRMDHERLLNREESRELLVRIANIENAAREQISALENENDELKKIILERDEALRSKSPNHERSDIYSTPEINDSGDENNNEKLNIDSDSIHNNKQKNDKAGRIIISNTDNDEINKLMIDILVILSNRKSISDNELSSLTRAPHAKIVHSLNILESKSFIENTGGYISLTNKGAALAVQFNLV